MTVAFDAKTTSAVFLSASSAGTLSGTNLTIGSGANRVLIAFVTFSTLTVTGVSVLWDATGTPQPLTKIIGVNSGGAAGRAELWGLVAPTPGNKTLRVLYTGTSDVELAGASFTGADQTGGATTFYNSTSTIGGSTTPTITATSTAGDIAVNACGPAGFNLSAATQTLIVLDNTPNTTGIGCQYAAGAASVVFGWTLSSSVEWAMVAASIKAAGSGIVNNKTITIGQGSNFAAPHKTSHNILLKPYYTIPSKDWVPRKRGGTTKMECLYPGDSIRG